MTTKAKRTHSEDVLNDSRDLWWSREYLALIAERCDFSNVHSVLEIGSGQLHFTRALLPHLPSDVQFQCFDKEEAWVVAGRAKADAMGKTDQIHVHQARAESLPVSPEQFDMVTCQTVLMHVADGEKVLEQLHRALKPGGLLLVAEPNNLAEMMVRITAHPQPPLETMQDILRLEYLLQRGKALLGRGDSSIGERLPGLLKTVGFQDIRTWNAETTMMLVPPYGSFQQQTEIQTRRDYLAKELVCTAGDRQGARECFLAAGGTEGEFERLFETALREARRNLADIEAERFVSAGAAVFYLTAARKPQGLDQIQ